MDTITIIALLAGLVIVVLVLVLLMILFRTPPVDANVSNSLQKLIDSSTESHGEVTLISERLIRLSSVPQTIGSVQTELTRLSERVSTVERNQNQVNQNVNNLATGITETKTLTQGLKESTNQISQVISRTKNDLTELQTQTKARQDQEQKTARSIERVEAIIAGTPSKGTAGENILDFVFAKLPAEWQVRDLRIDNKPVEFALRLPNGLLVPIDSKWAATNLVEQYSNCLDPDEQKRLKVRIEEAVLKKAREVKKYIDPKVTANFGIAAVPDAVYDLCPGVQVEAYRSNVLLISYSMFLPYLLLIFQTILKTERNLNLEELEAYLKSTREGLDALQKELEGRMAGAIKMLSNSRVDMSMTVSKLSGRLAELQAGPYASDSVKALAVSGSGDSVAENPTPSFFNDNPANTDGSF